MSPRFHKFWSLGPHGFHGIAYTEWGDPRESHIVVCVHGLTRNCRDFDVLAARLAEDCRVVCMDVVGRGQSDWLEHKEDYGFDVYVTDAAALIARLTAPPLPSGMGRLWRRLARPRAPRVDWIGTSMGGLLGMMLAAKRNTPIRRLVLNDVGPLVPWPALLRLKLEHSGAETRFADLAAVERHMRVACATFGPLDDARWRDVAVHSSRRLEDGTYALAFDPGIINAMRHSANQDVQFGNDFLFGVDLWPVWNAVQCPTLVLRGGESDLLLPSTIKEMQQTNPLARVVELPGIGHAPWLVSDEQVGLVRDFLSSPALP
jgi:pimeloyl-ACP methyl ester carboxylesterase